MSTFIEQLFDDPKLIIRETFNEDSLNPFFRAFLWRFNVLQSHSMLRQNQGLQERIHVSAFRTNRKRHISPVVEFHPSISYSHHPLKKIPLKQNGRSLCHKEIEGWNSTSGEICRFLLVRNALT